MLYQEIIEGTSPSVRGFFVKHLSELEQIELVRKRIEFINRYIKSGIPTEAERYKQIVESGDWTETEEGDVSAYRITISDNEKMLPSIIPIQQPAIRKIIEENKKQLVQLIVKKRLALGTTAEELADRDGAAFLGYMALYEDRACKKRLFAKWDDFESVPETQQEEYNAAIQESLSQFTDLNIRKISALPFFLNPFSYCKEAVYTFVNKPMCELTNYQIHLFSLGARNLNILSQAEGSPPDYFDKTPAEEVIKWYDQQYSIIVGKRKQALNS